ncbi:MAG: bacteriorhodopsin [Verrucomicrobiota bacterium]
MIETESLIQLLVNASFILAFMAMAGGSIFFFMMRDSVVPRYRSAMIVSGVILFIAALNYYYMKGWYLEAVNQGLDSVPTAYRYIDWLLTTPLMLIKFPLLLGLGGRGVSFMIKLIVLDIIMIVAGFFGELFIADQALHFGLFGLGALCWVAILYLLLTATSSLPERFPEVVRKSIRVMVMFVLIGWSIYPLGYVLPSFGLPIDIRELVYNIGDIINKVGLAVVVYIGAAAMTKQEMEFESQA